MSTAWVFAGQDAFEPTTGLAWADASQAVARNLVFAGDLCGLSLVDRRARRRLLAFGTAVVQPLLTALCLGIVEELRERGLRPDLVAGASLGEVSAWAVACEVGAPAAITLARARGLAMEEAAAASPGGMRAVRCSEQALRDVLARPGVSLGARNGPEEWVLTGSHASLASISARVVPVSGPWHSPCMASAATPLRLALPAPDALALPFLLNDAGRAATDAADATAHLVRQLTHPAQWYETVLGLEAAGVSDVVIVGPGRALRTQLRKIAPGLRVHRTDRPEQLSQVLA